MTTDDATSFLSKLGKDFDALDERDYDLESALAAGHKFALNPNSMPYSKMGGPDDFKAFVGRLVEARKAQLDATKGGDVMSDPKVQAQVAQWGRAFNTDPAAVLGVLQQAGKDAAQNVALMDVGYKIATQIGKDAFAVAQRLTMGVSENVAADTDLLRQLVGSTEAALAPANSILSNSARAVRRGGAQFGPKPGDWAKLRSLNGDMLATLVANAGGDLRNLQLIAKPSTWAKLVDFGNVLYTNNLLWGWKTQVVNTVSNTYMAMSRPAERILGSLTVGNAGASVRQQAYKQYYYMGASLLDSFKAAKEAFVLGNSKIAPHTTELYRTTGAAAGDAMWKPPTSVAALGHDAMTTLGLPTRFLGAMDEAAKVITYRSMVLSNAAMEAEKIISQQGMDAATALKFHKDFLNQRIAAAFDDNGYATDMVAKREAQVATFSQDLLPGSFGKAVQGFTNSYPLARLILPFVKTPTNILRYGWKLTPVLNLAQTEFREALLGRLGDTPEIRAMSAANARGQMALGTSFMAAAAYLAWNGTITGAGPSDPSARKGLTDSGWAPYSIRTINPDGSASYNSFSARMDPIAMPFGIVADLVTAANHPEANPSWPSAASALGIALMKNLADRTYLTGISQAIDAYSDPDRSFSKVAGNMAANAIPMSSMLRQVNPDPTMRDARGFMDKILATIPGFSENVPARRDVWGDPLTVHRGFSTTADGGVDQEMERLIMDTEDGRFITGVTPTRNGADLRDVTMADGTNAFEHLQELSGHMPGRPSLKSLVAEHMDTDSYRNAPDGSASVKGTKLWMIGSIVNRYHEAAMKTIMGSDANVRKAVYAQNEAVRAAYAAKQRDPVGAIPATQGLNKMLTTYGIQANPGPVTPTQ